MRTHVLTIIVGLLIVSSSTISLAGPPMTGSPSSTGSKWIGTLNPKRWSWPSMPWTAEKPRIQKKTPSVISSMNKSAKSSWTKTKRALDPTRMFDSGTKTKPTTEVSRSKQSEGGYFSEMFTTEESNKVRTVNDFLSQPQPR